MTEIDETAWLTLMSTLIPRYSPIATLRNPKSGSARKLTRTKLLSMLAVANTTMTKSKMPVLVADPRTVLIAMEWTAPEAMCEPGHVVNALDVEPLAETT